MDLWLSGQFCYLFFNSRPVEKKTKKRRPSYYLADGMKVNNVLIYQPKRSPQFCRFVCGSARGSSF